MDSGNRVESRDERRAEERRQRREQSERAIRDEMQRGSAGRVESRAPAETKRVLKERRKAREKIKSNDRLKLDLVRRALVLYIERAQRPSWCRTWREISTSTPTSAVRSAHLRF